MSELLPHAASHERVANMYDDDTLRAVGARVTEAVELKSDETGFEHPMDLQSLTPEDIDRISDPEQLKSLLKQMLQVTSGLEKRAQALEGNERVKGVLPDKLQRLSEIRFGLTDIDGRMTRPYVMSPGLAGAKQALEILANQGKTNAIILEGDPGTGKTQFAYSEVGQELQDGNDVALIHVRVKDTMRAQDLLYTIDNVRRLSDAQTTPLPDAVREEAEAWKRQILSGEIDPTTHNDYLKFVGRLDAITKVNEAAKDLSYENYIDLGPMGEAIVQSALGKKTYLLLDEVEKGREELMTGMLDELENLNFTIAETGDTIHGDKKNLRVIVTTNREKSDKIPDAFRRRCLYQYLEFPNMEEMAKIVELNYPNLDQKLEQYALERFEMIRQMDGLKKPPSTAELLSWISVLQNTRQQNADMKTSAEAFVPTDEHLNVLLKYPEDIEYVNDKFDERRRVEEAADLFQREIEQNPTGELAQLINNYLQVSTTKPSEQETDDEYEDDYDERDDASLKTVFLKNNAEYDLHNTYDENITSIAQQFKVEPYILAGLIDQTRYERMKKLHELANAITEEVYQGQNEPLKRLVEFNEITEYSDRPVVDEIDPGIIADLTNRYSADPKIIRDTIRIIRREQYRANNRSRYYDDDDENYTIPLPEIVLGLRT